MPIGTPEAPLQREAWIVGPQRARACAVIRHGVLDPRVAAQLVDRRGHRSAVLDHELLRSARERPDGACPSAGLDRDLVGGASAVAVMHDQLAGNVARARCGCGGQQELRPRGTRAGRGGAAWPGGLFWSTPRRSAARLGAAVGRAGGRGCPRGVCRCPTVTLESSHRHVTNARVEVDSPAVPNSPASEAVRKRGNLGFRPEP